MDFWQDFNLFVMGNLEKSLNGYLIFGIVAAISGLMAIGLDMINCYIFTKKSFLKLSYDKKNIIILFLAYGVCAGIIGLLAAILNVLNYTVQNAVIAGFGWSNIIPRLMTSHQADEEEQKDEGEEEE